jgi:hypothetical protein
MKPIIWVAILLIVLGIFTFAYQGFNYNHGGQGMSGGSMHSMDGGSTQSINRTQGGIPFIPILAGLALVGGIVLLVVRPKNA